MWAAGVLFALWCGAAPPAARASESPSSASLSGSGLLTLPDTAILAPGRFTAGLAVRSEHQVGSVLVCAWAF